MKKLILIILLLLTTGCYDFKELNSLAIIEAIGVDYQDDEYIVTFEILNDKKLENTNIDNSRKTTLVTTKDKKFVKAFEDAIKATPKDAYFYQLKLLLITENLASHGIEEVTDYLIRLQKINKSSYMVMVEDTTIPEILSLNIDNEPVISSAILDLISKNPKLSPVNTSDSFDLMLNNILKKGSDIALPSVKIADDSIALSTTKLFNQYQYVASLSESETKTYFLLKDSVYDIYYEDGPNTIAIYNNKVSYDYDDDTITITFKADGAIKTVDEKYDLKNSSTYTSLSKEYSNLIKNDILSLVNESIKNDSDFLKLGNLVYNKTPKEYYDGCGFDKKIIVKASINVNRNGLVYEVVK